MIRKHKKAKSRVVKATNLRVDQRFLDQRAAFAAKAGFARQKWIRFCEIMMAYNLVCELYEARQTVSKYITVSNGLKQFKVRFSNHAPIAYRESRGDCDFFVGHTNQGVTTTNQASRDTLDFFGIKE